MADKDSVVYIQAAFPLPPRASLKHGLTVGHTCSMKETKHMVAVAEYPAEPAATYGLTYVCKDIEHTSVGFAHACPNTALNKSSQ